MAKRGAIEAIDLRNLMRDRINEFGWSLTEAAKKVKTTAGNLAGIMDGSRGISPRLFCAMTAEWRVQDDRPLLQRWLLAFSREKLGDAALELFERADFTPLPMQVKQASQEFKPYARLGRTSEEAKRRLTILRALSKAGQAGLVSRNVRRAAREDRKVVELDMTALSVAELVTSRVVYEKLEHAAQDDTFKRSYIRTTRVRLWRLSSAGEEVVKALQELPDSTAAVSEAC